MIIPVTSMFPDDWKCTVTVARPQSTDTLGDRRPAQTVTIDDCLIARQSTTDPVDFSQVVNTRVVLSAPPGTDLRDGDEVTAPADYFMPGRWVVDGDPAAGPLGVAADLRRPARRK